MVSIGKSNYVVKPEQISYDTVMATITLTAQAKINLHLEITGLRDDGFHTINSIFQLVSLADLIKISTKKDTGFYSLKGNFNFPREHNLITKALKLFREVTGLHDGVEIECIKKIPAGAGLGGGSSDAASVLKGLNLLFNAGLSSKEMAEAGSTLGSDIPFFFGTGTAVVMGRGEEVKGIETLWDLPVVIIDTGIHVSTQEAYRKFDEYSNHSPAKIGALEDEYRKKPSLWPFYNDFFTVLDLEDPVYRNCINRLKSFGALYSAISGSGSAVFGIFSDGKGAAAAAGALEKEFKGVHKGKMLAIPPKAVYNSDNN